MARYMILVALLVVACGEPFGAAKRGTEGPPPSPTGPVGASTAGVGGSGGAEPTGGGGEAAAASGEGGGAGSPGVGGEAGAGGAAVGPAACQSAAGCPAPESPCLTPACIGGACGSSQVPDGTAAPDDGNDCTADVCAAGVETHPAKLDGDPCGKGHCEAAACICDPDPAACAPDGVCGFALDGCAKVACSDVCGVPPGLPGHTDLIYCDAMTGHCACTDAALLPDLATAEAICVGKGAPFYCGGNSEDVPPACVYSGQPVGLNALYCCK